MSSPAQHADRGTAAAMGPIAAAAEGAVASRVVSEAPTGMDTTTNGFAAQADMDEARDQFEEVEFMANGLGPVYNAQACRECHQNPVTGGGSQVTEFRTGHYDGANYIEPPGGSLNNDRAIDPSIQERVMVGQEVRTFRISPNIMGDGFVEAIDSNTLVAIATAQPADSSWCGFRSFSSPSNSANNEPTVKITSATMNAQK